MAVFTKSLTSQTESLHSLVRGFNRKLESNTAATITLNERLDVFQNAENEVMQIQRELTALVKRLCPDDPESTEPDSATPDPTLTVVEKPGAGDDDGASALPIGA